MISSPNGVERDYQIITALSIAQLAVDEWERCGGQQKEEILVVLERLIKEHAVHADLVLEDSQFADPLDGGM